MSQDLVAIAAIKRAIGLEGYCAVEPFGATLANLELPAEVQIGPDEKHLRTVNLEEIEQRPKGLVARFSAAQDRTQAERLNGLLIFVKEGDIPPLSEGQYYHFELKGMALISDETGQEIGVVRDVVNLPSTDAFNVALANGHEVLVPYNEQAVIKVEKESRRIIVRWSYLEELL